MKNRLGREGADRPFEGAFQHRKEMHYHHEKQVTTVFDCGLEELIDKLIASGQLKDGGTVSFHHHLRNGDYVLNMVMELLHKKGLKNLTIAASSMFPCHAPVVPMIEDETVTKIVTSYVSGPVAKAISTGRVKELCEITTHGGRPRSILEGELVIDVAFIAAPAVDKKGNISGSEGPSACGSMGYAVADAQMSKVAIAITDNLQESVKQPDIEGRFVDYVVAVDRIGDPKGIVSGTTQVTKDPVGLKIARDATTLIENSGLFQDGFSFQTGAGGISLAVAAEVRKKMIEKEVHGSFGCGGITGYFVGMLEENLFEDLQDVQCFDIEAVESIRRNENHHKITANDYANPNNPDHVAGKLDVVILGASEVDLDYNVNVTTGSDGIILGGSGGHADTAAGAKLTIITTKLFNARVSALVEKVRTVTTPGETIDAVVTERGICINPKRQDLIERIRANTNLELFTIEELYEQALSFTGKPKVRERSNEPVAYSVYRDGTVLDTIDRV